MCRLAAPVASERAGGLLCRSTGPVGTTRSRHALCGVARSIRLSGRPRDFGAGAWRGPLVDPAPARREGGREGDRAGQGRAGLRRPRPSPPPSRRRPPDAAKEGEGGPVQARLPQPAKAAERARTPLPRTRGARPPPRGCAAASASREAPRTGLGEARLQPRDSGKTPPPPPVPSPGSGNPGGQGKRRSRRRGVKGREAARHPHGEPRRQGAASASSSSPPGAGRGGRRPGHRTPPGAQEGAAAPPRVGVAGPAGMAGPGDKPLCRGLTFNRSQRGSCSATYETPTQKQVVYEWFSARRPTNVRCVTGEGAAAFPAAPHVPGRAALRTGTPVPTRGGRGTDPRRRRGTAGRRLAETNRGSRGAAVSFRLGGILT